MKATTLFENEFCKIVEINSIWYRFDKILKNIAIVDKYFNENRELIRR
mgnify:FL=1